MAPAATLMNVAVTYVDDDGEERYGFALVPTSAPGVEFAHDWDALGMRASESGSVTFNDVRVGARRRARRVRRPARYSASPCSTASWCRVRSTPPRRSASPSRPTLHIVTSLRGKVAVTLDDPHAVMRLAENVVDLASIRAVFDRAGRLIDEHLATHPTGEPSMADAQAVFGEVQAAKTHVNEAASRVVDRALAL